MADLAPPPTTKVSDVITSFRPTKQFKTSTPVSYTSIDHDDSGEFLLLSRTDDTIQMYNTKAGAPAKELKSQKYGSALARFTHHSQSIIYASTKGDDAIRYLSMHDNNFIRYFRGHEGRVTSLCLSPSGDQFMSSSLDGTVKLWDHRSSSAQGELRFEDPWLTAYDPSSTVFAVASPTAQAVVLYDLKNFDKPPFATFDLADVEKRYVHLGQRPAEGWTGLEFGNNGKFLLITTNGGGHYLLDAFSGDLVHYLHKSSGNGVTSRLAPGDPRPDPTSVYTQADACLSPDGRFVIGGSGSQSGLVVWDSQDSSGVDKVLKPSADLPSAKSAAVVAYNPRFNLLASADKDVLLWLPDGDL
ncbi:hypothetical protein LTR78_010867 [Recurvomyces mirabilis]|uniref:Uncharacterized protein n=1 Tax=Recurvomyces mirabilis TaxID=574656 RepID=A0AAE0TMA2_9PEZI|nr:hypothetical protein LTR78_010867 [Recurvomyces mirabilis]